MSQPEHAKFNTHPARHDGTAGADPSHRKVGRNIFQLRPHQSRHLNWSAAEYLQTYKVMIYSTNC